MISVLTSITLVTGSIARTVPMASTVSPMNTGLVKSKAWERQSAPLPGSLVPNKPGEHARVQEAMHDDLFEFSTCGELLVHMQTVIVAAKGGEGVDVFTTDGLADARARSDFEQARTDRRHG